MRSLTWKSVLVILLVAVFFWRILPPDQNLRLGKDLAGGTTLVYGIIADANGDLPTQSQIDEMIAVINDRINPKGMFDITIVAQGRSQIEISMPAPSDEVKARRQAYLGEIAGLERLAVGADEFDEVLRMEAEARGIRLTNLAGGDDSRLALMTTAAEANDLRLEKLEEYNILSRIEDEAVTPLRHAATAAQAIFDEAMQAIFDTGIPSQPAKMAMGVLDEKGRNERLEPLIKQASDPEAARAAVAVAIEAKTASREAKDAHKDAMATYRKNITGPEALASSTEFAFDEARRTVLARSLNIDELTRIIAMDSSPRRIRNRKTRQWEEAPSARETAVRQLIARLEGRSIDTPDDESGDEEVDDQDHSAPKSTMEAEIRNVIASFDRYRELSTGYDDPKELIALLRGSGLLEFRIAVGANDPDASVPIIELRSEFQQGGPANVKSSDQVGWFRLDKSDAWADNDDQLAFLRRDPVSFMFQRGYIAEEFAGDVYMLLYTTLDRSLTEANGDWELIGATSTLGDTGEVVNFELDAMGGTLFARLTGNNINRPLSILLDNRVYSAPNINSTIRSRGQITGRFSSEDIRYLLRVLNAGSLQAQLTPEPIAQSTIGPKLGKENLKHGLNAGIIALGIVAIFMVGYYFFAGVVANVALLCNAIFILGAMAFNQAAFTMPGIAGIVLTFGMAVDANVLIYERIREEFLNGSDLKTSIRLGYEKALSTIIDANVTNLIVCIVLGRVGTTEVKGFAITLGIGIIATLFSTLFITRIIFSIYTDVLHAKSLPMLPLVWRKLNRLLHPNLHWVNLRGMVWGGSGIVVIASILLTMGTWDEMLDTEFRGGSSVTITFKMDEATGQPIRKPRSWIESEIQAFAARAFDEGSLVSSTATPEELRRGLETAAIFNYNTEEVEDSEFRGSAFVIKTTIEDPAILERAAISSFGSILDIRQPATFAGAGLSYNQDPPVQPIFVDKLGAAIDRPEYTNDILRFKGGVAIVLDSLTPSMSLDEIKERIDRRRRTQEFEAQLGRTMEVVGLTRDDDVDRQGQDLWSSVAVLVSDENLSIFGTDEAIWHVEMGQKEWRLVVAALTELQSLDQVTTISPAIASQFRAKAIVSIALSLLGILAYIWVRFGSLRYSVAAIVALIHDVAVTMGLLALTHYLYDTTFGRLLFIDAFKIDLGVIAALLTIIGYSLNDTIVILDRIRENRGKLAVTSADVVNRSINQTISRTFLTSGTTLIALVVMYSMGGTGIRPFAFAMLCGVMVGTYSSIGIAAPMVFKKVTGNHGDS